MIFGKYINKYYLKNAPILILGLAALILVDYFSFSYRSCTAWSSTA